MHRDVTLVLIPHADSAPSRRALLADRPLSVEGACQADRLAGQLTELAIDRIFSSPYRRCVDTVAPFAAANQLSVTLCEALVEHRRTDGLEAQSMEWDRGWQEPDYAAPGCESARDAQARIVSLLSMLCATRGWRRAVVCSHASLIGLFLNAIDPRFHRELCAPLRRGEISVVHHDGICFRRQVSADALTFDNVGTRALDIVEAAT